MASTFEHGAGAEPSTAESASWSSVRGRPCIWGLHASELLAAWWRGQGVQWIQCGDADVDPDADLYLLTAPGQAVVFELTPLIGPITWNQPSFSRLRVVSADESSYRERVMLGAHGNLIGVRRVYWRQIRGSQRVLLTRSASIAKTWARATDRRSAWIQVRGSGAWSRSDHHRLEGQSYRLESQSDEGKLIADLADRWRDLDRVITGIREVRPSVWMQDGRELREGDIVLGPAWIGAVDPASEPLRAVGPTWVSDQVEARPAKVLPIGEIREASRAVKELPVADRGYDLVKRLVDVALSAVGLVVLAPLLAAIAVAVVIDDGFPIVFGHKRQTRGGRIFRCLKFRTMRRHAEAQADSLRGLNVCDGPQVYITNDPRVTRVGRLLRRYHLDELLQLVNVLVGDMSLVGPRPSPERENQLCPAWRDSRLSVRPGITGLWQVSRTRAVGLDFQEWIRFDMEYVEQRCLRLDARIVWLTMVGILSKEEVPDGAVEAIET